MVAPTTYSYSASVYLGVSEDVARSSMWEFQELPRTLEDGNVADYRYCLQRVGNAKGRSPTLHPTWVRALNPSRHPLCLSSQLNEGQQAKVAFGHDCFRVLKPRNVGPMSWSQLQYLTPCVLPRRWSNVCSVNATPPMRRLLTLLDLVPTGARSEPYFVLSVEAEDVPTRSRWDLTYKLEHGEWIARSNRARRTVDGNFDLIMDDCMAFRLQTYSRPDPLADARPLITATIPDNGDAWDTSVASTDTRSLIVRSFNIKRKTKVELGGLVFSVGCLDRDEDSIALQSAVRLKCRLFKDCEQSHENPRVLLADRVLAVLDRAKMRN